MSNNIDFVLTWVDDSDPIWLQKKNKYSVSETSSNNSEVRYRDWELLKYWFRSIEMYAPWLNKVFLIVDHPVPKWLNLEYDKLVVVQHTDFIPKEYLPTFNSRTIELNMHRIVGLSEKFVYFNDDMFLNQKVEPKDFFVDGLPVDIGSMNIVVPNGSKMSPILFKNLEIINKNFSKRNALKNNFSKFFNWKYGILNLRTLYLFPIPLFLGFFNPHLPISFLKKNFYSVWSLNKELCDFTCKDKFRESTGINLWLIRYWQLASGNFFPQSKKFGKYIGLDDENIFSISKLLSSKYKVFCINDNENLQEFDSAKQYVQSEFESKYNKKSKYEK